MTLTGMKNTWNRYIISSAISDGACTIYFQTLKKNTLWMNPVHVLQIMFLDGDSIFMNYRKCFVLSSLLDCKFEAEWRHFSFNRIVIRNYIWKGWYLKRTATCNKYLLLVFTCMETQSTVL